jgi:hypothetical protein
VVNKTSPGQSTSDTTKTILIDGTTITQKQCFGDALPTMTKGLVTFTTRRLPSRELCTRP